MPNIIVSNHAYTTIQRVAIVPFEKAGHQRPNGDWEVFVSDDYINRIIPKMLPGENISEAIERWYPAAAAS